MTEPKPRPRTALAVCELSGLLAIVIGVAVGLTDRFSASYGGTPCGSVLGGGGSTATMCDRIMSSPTTWTWLLIVAGLVLIAAGWIVDTIRRNNTGTAPAAS